MTKRVKRKHFVIDADVLVWASGNNRIECMRCHEFIESVLEICFGLVSGGLISQEWKDHSSYISNIWIRKMINKKKIKRNKYKFDGIDKLIHRIKNANIFTSKQFKEIEKDKHLIAAALVNDSIIVSCDNTARKLYAKAAQNITKVGTQIGDIIWINPAIDDERPIDWLESGAPASEDKKLINFLLS